jgi:hypothetical protein
MLHASSDRRSLGCSATLVVRRVAVRALVLVPGSRRPAWMASGRRVSSVCLLAELPTQVDPKPTSCRLRPLKPAQAALASDRVKTVRGAETGFVLEGGDDLPDCLVPPPHNTPHPTTPRGRRPARRAALSRASRPKQKFGCAYCHLPDRPHRQYLLAASPWQPSRSDRSAGSGSRLGVMSADHPRHFRFLLFDPEAVVQCRTPPSGGQLDLPIP